MRSESPHREAWQPEGKREPCRSPLHTLSTLLVATHLTLVDAGARCLRLLRTLSAIFWNVGLELAVRPLMARLTATLLELSSKTLGLGLPARTGVLGRVGILQALILVEATGTRVLPAVCSANCVSRIASTRTIHGPRRIPVPGA